MCFTHICIHTHVNSFQDIEHWAMKDEKNAENPTTVPAFCLGIAFKLQCGEGEPMWSSADSLS